MARWGTQAHPWSLRAFDLGAEPPGAVSLRRGRNGSPVSRCKSGRAWVSPSPVQTEGLTPNSLASETYGKEKVLVDIQILPARIP
jgi:hypothetical protein